MPCSWLPLCLRCGNGEAVLVGLNLWLWWPFVAVGDSLLWCCPLAAPLCAILSFPMNDNDFELDIFWLLLFEVVCFNDDASVGDVWDVVVLSLLLENLLPLSGWSTVRRRKESERRNGCGGDGCGMREGNAGDVIGCIVASSTTPNWWRCDSGVDGFDDAIMHLFGVVEMRTEYGVVIVESVEGQTYAFDYITFY